MAAQHKMNCMEELEIALRTVAANIRALNMELQHFEVDKKHATEFQSQLEQSWEHMKALHFAIDGIYGEFRPFIEMNNGFFIVKREDTAA